MMRGDKHCDPGRNGSSEMENTAMASEPSTEKHPDAAKTAAKGAMCLDPWSGA